MGNNVTHNYKVVAVDNYARETVSDRLILVRLTEPAAKQICDILNVEHAGGDSFYVVKPYEYTLYKYEE